MARRQTQTTQTENVRPIRLRWAAIAGGLAVSYVVQFAGGVILARLGLAGSLAALPAVQAVALFAGGYVAGRWAGVSGFWNGVAVAVAFILVWAVLNPIYEARLVAENGPLALPRMNMGGIILGDLLNLGPAAFGGYLAERRQP
jgi:hypothetical protein